jgi:hypothetical protein
LVAAGFRAGLRVGVRGFAAGAAAAASTTGGAGVASGVAGTANGVFALAGARRVRVSFGAYCFFFASAGSAGALFAGVEASDSAATDGVGSGGAAIGAGSTTSGAAGDGTLAAFEVEAVVRRRRGAIEGGVDAVGAVDAERDFDEPDLPLAMMSCNEP